MRVLIITPVEGGSGETITAVHMAENLVAKGHLVLFLASPFACLFIQERFSQQVQQFSQNGAHNRQIWNTAVEEFRPDVVVFADYPLMFFPFGVSPLVSEPGWVESLEEIDACLVTLDHFGFAQHEMGFYFGPAHLSYQYQWFPAIPERMHILLPCPMHEPGPVEGRRGEPFRYWEVPLGVPDGLRRDVRQRYLERDDDLLVFHSVPNWAWQAAEVYNLSFYDFLPQVLDEYFGNLPKQVTIVSVNNGDLLTFRESRARIINLDTIPKSEFEGLLFSSDLMITENKVSISMGKAVCGLQACAALINSYRLLELMDGLKERLKEIMLAMENRRPGTVFPYAVFPSGMSDMLNEIILYRGNSLTEAFCEVEIFGGEKTASTLSRLLIDPQTRDELRARQQLYVDKLRKLGDSERVLYNLVEQHRRAC